MYRNISTFTSSTAKQPGVPAPIMMPNWPGFIEQPLCPPKLYSFHSSVGLTEMLPSGERHVPATSRTWKLTSPGWSKPRILKLILYHSPFVSHQPGEKICTSPPAMARISTFIERPVPP